MSPKNSRLFAIILLGALFLGCIAAMHFLNASPFSNDIVMIVLGALGFFIALVKAWKQEPDTRFFPTTDASPWRMYFIIATVIIGIIFVIFTIYFPQTARTILQTPR